VRFSNFKLQVVLHIFWVFNVPTQNGELFFHL